MLLALVAGALLGLALATTGGGGAVLAVPVLAYALGQSVSAATTESLLIVVAAAAAGAAAHARSRTVCWRIAAVFAAAAIPGTMAGTLLNQTVDASALIGAFAVLLLVVAALVWRRARVAAEALGACPHVALGAAAAAGLAIGALTGLFGVGGGFAVVPALVLGLHVPLRRAIATSLVIVTVVATLGLASHVAAGATIDWAVTVPFAAAAVVTASRGAALGRRVPAAVLSRGFAAILTVVATYLLASVALLGGPPHG